ncbi:MAG: ABC transporter ATP-binding protein [Gemmatimonadetes bacterium]|uniref:ABC transporter ATP-binding protein n=1 Tax=Candidatus Kutchimonas denitrificans TaxID=3056748 RepID=A0AAE5C8Q6_9BACT|nr:ABC transporter ATP-binding protein [Gemmatimonadota bacterium]NIR74701.1 ABC transporter ATP-binding protein [Candidatus Kutchimonas denitrificans]NIS01451.1 ABC transporter ATP-binding protein [Gemmatimonadota bacterium]NIT67192.1 ABC transporter ATP-binding protein [Gemmatimonadota bacterium]NIU52366.1 ATP-binding cassette domain-containing protein [Gemmatimonadota bacterium]
MSVYSRLIGYLRPYRWVFVASLLAMTLGSLLDGFTMVLLIPFLRSLFGEASALSGAGSLVERVLAATVGPLIDGATPAESLRNVVFVVMAGLLLKNIFFYAAEAFGVKVREGVVRDMRNQLYGHIQKLPLGFFDRSKAGQLMARVFSDTQQTKDIVTYTVSELLKHVVSLVAFVTMLFLISWKLTLIALVVAPLFLGFLKPMLGRLRRGFRRAHDAQGELTSMLQETASGARLVKAYGAEDYESQRFAEVNRSYNKTFVRTERIRLLSSPLSEVLGSLVTLVLVWVGAQFVFGGEMTAEAFLTFLTISLRVQSPIKALTTFPARAQVSMAAADRFFEILDSPIEADLADGPRLEKLEEGVEYENVHFSYDGDEPVLKGVSFSIQRGEVVALVGPSGAGKSTIVDLLPRFYEPQRGRITIDGVDVANVSLGSLRDLLGVVSQETVIFHDTVRANIAYGDADRYTQEQIEEAARAANAHDFILRLPKGYDTVLGDRGLRLSGGQRQRIAIARAILRDPPLLIFDEATSSLDTESERLVQGAIDHLLENRTVIVVAHRLSTIRNAHQIIVLQNGAIVESGRHDDLLARRGVYRRLYELQFTDADDGGARSEVTVS